MIGSRGMMRGLNMVLVVGWLTLTPRMSLGQPIQELMPGKVVQGSAGWGGSAEYSFKAETAGVLTVVARSLDENDLQLLVADMAGQPLPEGRSDQDLGGDVGAEQFAVTLPRAGTYRVTVEAFAGGQANFHLGVSWISIPGLEVPADPDGSPGSAQRISVGQNAREDSIDGPAGDFWDWFVLKADKAGTLTLVTRTDGGDLVLEAFEAGKFAEALKYSDQDLQGNGGSEAVTLVVEPGQEFFFKISAFSEGVSVPYRLQVEFIPG